MRVLVNTLTAIDGTCIKQGDTSVLRFKLGDFNDDELRLDPVATVYLSHGDDVYKYDGRVHNDVVSFHMNELIPAAVYTVEVTCGGYIFPSDNSVELEVVESQLGKAMTKAESNKLYDEIIDYGVNHQIFRNLLDEERRIVSESISESLSLSTSVSESISTSTSLSQSVSASLSTSESISESLSLSVATSLSNSYLDSVIASESASLSMAFSISESTWLSESESISKSLSTSESTSRSLSTALSVSASESIATSYSLAHTPSTTPAEVTDNNDDTFTTHVITKNIFKDENGTFGINVDRRAFDFKDKKVIKVEFKGGLISEAPELIENTIYWPQVSDGTSLKNQIEDFISRLEVKFEIGGTIHYENESIQMTYRMKNE